jgi:hypothetical protein
MIAGDTPDRLHASFGGLDYHRSASAHVVGFVDPTGDERILEEGLGIVGKGSAYI